MIPFAGFLADLSVLLLLFSLAGRWRNYWPLIGYYSAMSLWNLSVSGLFLIDTEIHAHWILYITHHFIPFYSLTFLWAAMHFSGRTWNWAVHIANVMPLMLCVILEYSFWFTPDDKLFISGVQRYSWGYYPIIGPGAKFYTVMSFYCFLLGAYYYWNSPKKDQAFRTTRFYLLLAWLGISTSFLPTFGVDIFPLGNASDAIISIFMAAALFRRENLNPRARIYFKVAGGSAAIAVMLIFSWIFSDLLHVAGKVGTVLTTVAGAALGIFCYQVFYRPGSPVCELRPGATESPVFAQLQVCHSLTYQESTICAYLLEGQTRAQICYAAGISMNTLKVHLSSIYRKTIDADALFASSSRDKLQRLTVFLKNLEKNSVSNT